MSNLAYPSSMPYDEIKIIDRSTYEDTSVTEVSGVPSGPIAFIPFISPRGFGDDNTLTYMTASVLNKFGIPSVRKYGLSLYLAHRFINGGGNLLGMRVVPKYNSVTGYGATYANACVCAVVKNIPQGKDYYVEATSSTQGALQVVADSATPSQTQIKLCNVVAYLPNAKIGDYVVKKTSTGTDNKSIKYYVKTMPASTSMPASAFAVATPDSLGISPLSAGETLYKLFVIRSRGAGDYANAFKFALGKDETMAATVSDAFFYKFEDKDGTATLDQTMVFTFADSYMYDSESMDPEDVFDAYSKNVAFEKVTKTGTIAYKLTADRSRDADALVVVENDDSSITTPVNRYVRCDSGVTGALLVVSDEETPGAGEIAQNTVKSSSTSNPYPITDIEVGEYVKSIETAKITRNNAGAVAFVVGDFVDEYSAHFGINQFMSAIGADGVNDFILSDSINGFKIDHTALNSQISLAGAVKLWNDDDYDFDNDKYASILSEAYGVNNNLGIFTDEIYDQIRFPYQYIFAPSYSDNVIEAIHSLVLDRDITHALYFCKESVTFDNQISVWGSKANSWKEAVYSQWAYARDPYSGKKTKFPSVYFNALKYPRLWNGNKGRAYAGKSNFAWDDFVAGTIMPRTCSDNQLIKNHNAKFNTLIEDGFGNATPYEQITAYGTLPSQLSEINNSFILTDMIRICLNTAYNRRWSSLDNSDINDYRQEVINNIEAELKGTYSYFDVTATAMSVNGAGRNRIKCVISTSFKKLLKGVSYEFYINAE